MTTFNWIIVGLTLLGWAVTIGVYCQKFRQMEERQKAQDKLNAQERSRVDNEITSLKKWGEGEIAKAVQDRNDNFVRKDVLKECLEAIRHRLDQFESIKIGEQLSEIKAMIGAKHIQGT